MNHLETPSGAVALPAFFPDATYGAIRAGSFEDVYSAGLSGCEMNSYHLMTKPGAKLVRSWAVCMASPATRAPYSPIRAGFSCIR